MKKHLFLIIFLIAFPTFASAEPYRQYCQQTTNPANVAVNRDEIPAGLQRLLKAYPDHLKSATSNALIWKDGSETIYDAGVKHENYDHLLNFPSLFDQLSMAYPIGALKTPPEKNFDPGRVRYEPFFQKMYGKNESEVRAKLTAIAWMPNTVNKKILITTVNGVHEKLQAVSNELDNLPPQLKKYVTELGGTFNWRPIAATNRLSPHSYGIAIDINVKFSNYWQWENPNPNANLPYKNKIPMEIVTIFEKHGFIWGGKWYHYDTMHFEYRPELLE
jgi:hypothetical protein